MWYQMQSPNLPSIYSGQTTQEPSVNLKKLNKFQTQLFTEELRTVTSKQDIQFTTNNIVKAIKELKTNSTTGPNSIPAILLYKNSLALPLYIMWH